MLQNRTLLALLLISLAILVFVSFSEKVPEWKIYIVDCLYHIYRTWKEWIKSLEVSRLHKSLLFGTWMMLFTWMITYLDSKQPGIQPPSPVSPKKFRLRSGHTFHLGYAIALFNGVVFAVLSFNTSDRDW